MDAHVSLQEVEGNQRFLAGRTEARPSPQLQGCPQGSGQHLSPLSTRKAIVTEGLHSPTGCGKTDPPLQVRGAASLGVGTEGEALRGERLSSPEEQF